MLFNSMIKLIRLKCNEIFCKRNIAIILTLSAFWISIETNIVFADTSYPLEEGEFEPSEYNSLAVCDFIYLRIFEMDSIQKMARKTDIRRLLPKYEDNNYGEFRYEYNIGSDNYSYFDFTINKHSNEFILEYALYYNFYGFRGIYQERKMVYERFGVIEMNNHDIIRLYCEGFGIKFFFQKNNSLEDRITKFVIFRIYRG